IHFLKFGQKEKRIPNWGKFALKGSLEFQPSLDTILVVNPEAELSDNTILSVSLIQHLRKNYNIISLIFKGGALLDFFINSSVMILNPDLSDFKDENSLLDYILEQLVSTYKIKYAIVNSIFSSAVLPALSKRFIPSINLINESAAHVKYITSFPFAALWAHETIYSTSMTYQSTLEEFPVLKDQPVQVIPKCYCPIPEIRSKEYLFKEEIANLQYNQEIKDDPNTITIIGLGSGIGRKTLDTFITCAERITKSKLSKNVHFVWLGNGYHPENEIKYATYLADRFRKFRIECSFTIVQSAEDIKTAYESADIFVLCSNLDPLPNYAIDAMIHKLPVVCFEKATGVADILKSMGVSDECIASNLDIGELAGKILALVESEDLRMKVGNKLHQNANKIFNIYQYISRLKQVELELESKIRQERQDFNVIKGSGIYRLDYYPPKFQNENLAIIHYIRSWRSGVNRWKLVPGFHPDVYLDYHQIKNREDPLAHYIRNGMPDGPWKYPVITNNDEIQSSLNFKKIALHLHVHYPELLPDILSRLNKNENHPDLFVSVSSKSTQNEIEELIKQYKGQVKDLGLVPNRGRDIGAFLTEFSVNFIENYEILGHIHTKKSMHLSSETSTNWRLFLFENLIGGKYRMMDIILNTMKNNPLIGLVFPDDPNIFGWNENLPFAHRLCDKLGITNLQKHINFPAGTMFWARTDSLKPLFELNLHYDDYPEEPVPLDGSLLHAIERLLPYVVALNGYNYHVTNVEGVTR
ncbi:MAG: rhamnan synthesis F family protein, partial [Candidatus Helarchaeota archaeon]